MWRRIFAIVVKELRQLSRDRMTFGMIVMIPLVQLMLFGYAINTDARHLPAGLVNLSDSAYSRGLVKAVEATQVVDFKQRYLSAAEAEAAITRGEVKAVLYLPADLDERLVRHPSFVGQQYLTQSYIAQPAGQWLVDGSDTVVASTIRSLRQMPLDEVAGRAKAPGVC